MSLEGQFHWDLDNYWGVTENFLRLLCLNVTILGNSDLVLNLLSFVGTNMLFYCAVKPLRIKGIKFSWLRSEHRTVTFVAFTVLLCDDVRQRFERAKGISQIIYC